MAKKTEPIPESVTVIFPNRPTSPPPPRRKTTIHEVGQLTALIECNNDLRRELDAANRLIRELYEENDKLTMKILNLKNKGNEQ